MWVLFQDILTFTVNDIEPQSYYTLLQSMLKVFSLFQIKFQSDGDELSEFFIQFTCCNNFFNRQISDVKQELFTKKKILPVLSKLECFIMLVFCG